MLANAAFILGLTLDLAPEMGELLPGFPFDCAERNFYRAAQQGLAAELLWPVDPGAPPQPVPARDLLPSLIERAQRGLESSRRRRRRDPHPPAHLHRPGRRAASPARSGSGAAWPTSSCAGRPPDRPRAVALMLQRYMAHAATGRPVHTWSP